MVINSGCLSGQPISVQITQIINNLESKLHFSHRNLFT